MTVQISSPRVVQLQVGDVLAAQLASAVQADALVGHRFDVGRRSVQPTWVSGFIAGKPGPDSATARTLNLKV